MHSFLYNVINIYGKAGEGYACLFGSYASGDFNEESDLDFYIVLKDGATNLAELTAKAYRAIRQIKRRPVDIVMGTQSRFEERKIFPSIENEVFEKGVLLYEA